MRERGVDAAAVPLISILPVPDPLPLRSAWTRLGALRLVVFVSPNAVWQFFAERPPAMQWPGGLAAATAGPGTTAALVALGVPCSRIVEPASDSPQMDSEALWAQLSRHDWGHAEVLFVRGQGGREWLADRLREHGANVTQLAAYRRAAPVLDRDQRRLAQSALDQPGAHAWLFSSAEAVDNLAQTLPQANWSASLAIATHPRIVRRALDSGFARVRESRPLLDDVVTCIQSFGP